MKWLRLLLLLPLALSLLAPAIALAGNEISVTVTASPLFTGGITSFTITYVSDTNLKLDWVMGGDAVQVMIRAKYGAYPADIPDQFTAPTDGYLAYYGAGLTTNDTSMNFDQNPGYLHYKAWAQRGDGTWHTDVATGLQESKVMLLLTFAFLALTLTAVMFVTRSGMLGWPAAMFWAVLAYESYTRRRGYGTLPMFTLHYSWRPCSA